MTDSSDGPVRRRRHSSTPRRRRIVIRFSDEEFAAITGQARSSGTAVAAWLAHQALTGSAPVSSELVAQLVAVRAELVTLAARVPVEKRPEAEVLLDRLDVVIAALASGPS